MSRTIAERLAVVETQVLVLPQMAEDIAIIKEHIIEERARRNLVRTIGAGIAGVFGLGAALVKILTFFGAKLHIPS